MGKTIIEKIISNHAEKDVKPGDIVWMHVDVVSARDFGGPNVIKNYKRYYGDTPVVAPDSTYFTFDLSTPAKSIKYATAQHLCRQFAYKHGIRVFDVDAGIGTHVLMEHGILKPGMVSTGTDSHFNILGAIGVLGQGMGDVDITYIFRKKRTWFRVPETVKVKIKGMPEKYTEPKDVVLYILKRFKTSFALGKSLEMYGEYIKNLDMAGRITIASMVTEMGGIVAFLEYGENFKDEFSKFTGVPPGELIESDSDAEYSDEVEIDITSLPPQIARPGAPWDVVDVKELKGVKVDSVFVGSCTNGRERDMETFGSILKMNKVKERVMVRVKPATRKVYEYMLDTGLISHIFKAGGIVINPGCGGCAQGHEGLTGEGEVQVSTSNRNFPGKQGRGKTYLASPLMAAISSITGEILPPEEVL